MKLSLYEFIEQTYNNLLNLHIGLDEKEYKIIKFNSFEKIINDSNLCVDFIRCILDDDPNAIIFNKQRATHILVTWLLGVALADTFQLNKYPAGVGSLYLGRIWLQTAITHDYGYFRKEVKDEDLQIENLIKEHNLFMDDYGNGEFRYLNNMSIIEETKCFFSYTYDEVLNYFQYRKEQLKNDKNEKNDHGIIGGALVFSNYCKKVERDLKMKLKNGMNGIYPSPAIMKEQKIACFIAATHNIFKSDSAEKDAIYRRYSLFNLLSTSPKRVTIENKLLMLMSLVDTIECTKRFSERENPKAYLHEKTVLKRTSINVLENGIELDFNDLHSYIINERKEFEMDGILIRHVNAVASINTWTDFDSDHMFGSKYVAVIKTE